MQIDRMKNHLYDAMNVEGDLIEFGIYKGTSFSHLVSAAMNHGRMAYGIDSFKGLSEPSQYDWNDTNTLSYPKGKFAVDRNVAEASLKKFLKEPTNYEILEGFIPSVLNNLPETNYAFAIVDLVHYYPTKQALEYIWDKMSYGGTIYLDNYFPTKNNLCSKAIKEFLEEHEDEIITSRQMMINGIREKELAIKCLREELKPKDWSKNKLLKRPLSVALVLRSGGIYGPKHVNNISEAIKDNLTLDNKVFCLTDDRNGIGKSVDKVIQLKHNFPKWWSKVELFRPDIFERQQVLYVDLDTFIIDNIDDIALYDGEFCALRDFYHLHSMGSGLLSWHGKRANLIYDKFLEKSKNVISSYTEGDQRWIEENRPSVEYFQDVYPNQIVSFKRHCLKDGNEVNIPKKASIICFHGSPRPHEVTDPKVKRFWKQD